MSNLPDLATTLTAALPTELRGLAAELATLLSGLTEDDVATRIAARPALATALATLVGQTLHVAGQSLHVAGNVGMLQHVTVSGGYVEKAISNQTQITITLPPTARVIDPAAAQELLAALPMETLAPVAPLPELHRMPFARNHNFVGREADLVALARALKGEGATAAIGSAAATTGLGGVGKTNLATEFAHRYGQFFAGGVFWLSFADPDTIPLEIAACGTALDLPGFADLKLEDQVQRVRAAWAQPIPRLLIFDNCDETEPGRAEALIQQWRPTTGGCRVLITSRRGVWSASLGVTTLPLGVLNRDDSIALLRKHRPDLAADDPALDAIAAELGDLPLALHLAGSYLENYRDSAEFGDPATFLSELRDTRLLDHEALQGVDSTPSPTNHELHVARTFALSYDRLMADDPTDAQALRLLARVAHLAPGNIVPRDLALATLMLEAEDRTGRRQAERGLRELLSLGLIEREGDEGLRMHRLVGAYVRQVSADGEAQEAVEQVVIREAGNMVDASTLAPINAFLPILRGVTDAALGRKGVRAVVLCVWLGEHLGKLGSYASAQSYFERVLVISERVLGSENPAIATIINKLADLHQAQGNYGVALPLSERALAMRERVLGGEHPDTAQSLNSLARLHQAQGNYGAALPIYDRALAIQERVLGAEHPATATSIDNLATLHEAQGNYEVALPLCERALAIRERRLGAEHPHTAQSLNNLAGLLENQGNYAAALPLYERALAIHERRLGAEHPQTATSLNNLAMLYYQQGNYGAALPLYERALVIRERVMGTEHPNTAQSLNNLAELYRAQGNYEAALPIYQRALTTYEQALGAAHPHTIQCINNLATLHHAQGDYADALLLLKHALAIREEVLGATHPHTAQSLNNLAALHDEQGNYDAALPIYQRALAINEQALGRNHPHTATSLNNLAINYYCQGDLPNAERMMSRALQIREARLGADHPETQDSRRNLAAIRRKAEDTGAGN